MIILVVNDTCLRDIIHLVDNISSLGSESGTGILVGDCRLHTLGFCLGEERFLNKFLV